MYPSAFPAAKSDSGDSIGVFMETHVKVLGVLNIVSGVLGLCAALLLLIVFGGVAGLVGAGGDPDAAVAVPIIGLTGAVVVVFVAVMSLPAVVIGYGLYRLRPWSRLAGIVLSIISLISFPVGTLLGGAFRTETRSGR
jgi:hypothetical protein